MNILILGWCGVAVGALCLLYAHLQYRIDGYLVRRHSSRFQLFAARDQLVQLVASGAMSESDVAWQTMYRTINAVLDLSRKMNRLQMLVDYGRFRDKASKDPALASRADTVDRLIFRRAQELPAFAAVLERANSGLSEIIGCQTKAWHLAVIRLLAIIVRPLRWVVRDSAAIASTSRMVEWQKGRAVAALHP